MGTQTLKITRIRPNIHYLDLIAKIYSKRGTVKDLMVNTIESNTQVTFSYSFPSFSIEFSESIIYNNIGQIIHWAKSINDEKEIIIYQD